MRHEEFDETRLKQLAKEIQKEYGVLSIEILNKASVDKPEKYPSYKTFERKLGGIKVIRKSIESY